jgi:hypothetical protein
MSETESVMSSASWLQKFDPKQPSDFQLKFYLYGSYVAVLFGHGDGSFSPSCLSGRA